MVYPTCTVRIMQDERKKFPLCGKMRIASILFWLLRRGFYIGGAARSVVILLVQEKIFVHEIGRCQLQDSGSSCSALFIRGKQE